MGAASAIKPTTATESRFMRRQVYYAATKNRRAQKFDADVTHAIGAVVTFVAAVQNL
jgi:hypothetical protein